MNYFKRKVKKKHHFCHCIFDSHNKEYYVFKNINNIIEKSCGRGSTENKAWGNAYKNIIYGENKFCC